MSHRYDVAIVGAGTAGLSAMREVKKQTGNFILINAGPYGTTCARVGCMPSKVLIETANAFHRRKILPDFGVRGAENLEMDISAALSRVRRLRDGFVAGALKATENMDDRVLSGKAVFTAPDVLSVDGHVVHAKRIIIAAGSTPFVPEAWKHLGDRVITTDDLFEMASLPPDMAIVGLGPIGAEMAQALSRLGINITAFGKDDGIAGLSDPAVCQSALDSLKAEFDVHIGAAAGLEAAAGEKVRIHADNKDVVVDKVVAALGRRPNIDDMGLENLGVELDPQGIPSFDRETMQVGDLPVFIAGDVNNDHPILHEASDEGFIAGQNAVSASFSCYRRRTPLSIVFADPNMAVAGSGFADLPEEGYVIGEMDFSGHGRALAAATNRGLLRVYAEKESGRILGAEMCAPAGEHLAHLLSLAIGQGLGVNDLLRMPFYHPVIEEGLRTALRRAARQLPAGPVADLAACEGFAPGS